MAKTTSQELLPALRELPPRRGWRRSEWSAIPHLAWAIAVREGTGVPGSTKLMARAFATAVDITLRRPGADPSVMALVRARHHAGHVEYTIVCPYAAPLEVMYAMHHGDGSHPVRQPFMERATAIDLELRFGLMEGTFVPLHIRAGGSDTIVLANHGVLNDPGQHLEPEACRSTSGLLAFIGAMGIAGTAGIAEVDPQRLIARGLDEWLRWLAYAVHTGDLLDVDRLLLDQEDPERYVYDFDGSRVTGGIGRRT